MPIGLTWREAAVRILGALALALGPMACAHGRAPTPPEAQRMPHQTIIHGQTRIDDYHWLRQRDDPKVREYLERENEYTEEQMAHTRDLQQQLFDELKGRLQETDQTVPVKHGAYTYYSRTVKGQQYAIHCRRKDELEAKEEILFDENEMAAGHDYFDLGVYDNSSDHRLLAFTVDTEGSEIYTLRILDTRTGQLLPDLIERISGDFTWADDATIFYVRMDAALRPYQLWRHKLGRPAAEDALVYQEDDEAFYLGISRTRSRAYVLMHLGSLTQDEIRFLPADDPDGTFQVVQPRTAGLEYTIDHRGDQFYIVTNHQAENFRLMRTDTAHPGLVHWQEFVPYRPEVKVEDVDLFARYLVVHLRESGLTAMRILDFDTGQWQSIVFPEAVHTCRAGENPEFDSPVYRLVYSSMITPRTVYDYHPDERRLEVKKQDRVLGGYDPQNYVSERLEAVAGDGTHIPISLLYKKGLQLDGRNPAYLRGYGAYGLPFEPDFDPDRLSLVDRGFVFAIAHVRGGGEMGRPWYRGGKLENKINTFRDFITCAEHLIARKYTAPGRLAIGGGSAGGLLIGAVLNMQPDLFAVAVAHVPFVDVVNTMLDDSIPLTVVEYEEWGNPHRKAEFDLMMAYSPYDGVKRQDYPHMLVTAGLNDPRVQYWEPAKWVARLRAMKTDDHTLLLKTKMEAGHFGASGRYEALRETAFEYAFLIDKLKSVP